VSAILDWIGAHSLFALVLFVGMGLFVPVDARPIVVLGLRGAATFGLIGALDAGNDRRAVVALTVFVFVRGLLANDGLMTKSGAR
jgi:hypothetical protein